MRTLIVGNDRSIADLLKDGLADDDHVCDMAMSATEGEALALPFPYSLLLLDVRLPWGSLQLGTRLRPDEISAPILSGPNPRNAEDWRVDRFTPFEPRMPTMTV